MKYCTKRLIMIGLKVEVAKYKAKTMKPKKSTHSMKKHNPFTHCTFTSSKFRRVTQVPWKNTNPSPTPHSLRPNLGGVTVISQNLAQLYTHLVRVLPGGRRVWSLPYETSLSSPNKMTFSTGFMESYLCESHLAPPHFGACPCIYTFI